MSLLQIAKVPTAENSAIHLNEADNIAVARVPLAEGNEVRVDGIDIGVRDPIPAGHKVALKSIPTGANIVRYGQVIGRARIPIEPGQHVHTHNVAFDELTFDYEFPVGERKLENTPRNVPTFLGYAREDGRAGTRNYIAVVAASNCAAHTAEQIAASFGPNELPAEVDGVVAFPHGEGCGHAIGPDTDQLRRTLGGVLDHPNVAGAIILGLGCEVNQIEHYLGPDAPSSDRLVGMTVQGSRRNSRDGRGCATRAGPDYRAGGRGKARRVACLEDRAGIELRRVRFVLRHHGESGAGILLGPAGRDRRDGSARGDDGDLRRRAPAGEARAESRDGGAPAEFRR